MASVGKLGFFYSLEIAYIKKIIFLAYERETSLMQIPYLCIMREKLD